MKFIKANHDKPHRCNECHRVARVFYEDGHKGGASMFAIYKCPECEDTYWWKGWSDSMAWTWFHGPVRHTKNRFFRRMRRMAYGLHLRDHPY